MLLGLGLQLNLLKGRIKQALKIWNIRNKKWNTETSKWNHR